MKHKAPPPLPLDGHAAAPEHRTVAIADIVVDRSIHPRRLVMRSHVHKLARALAEGSELLRPIVFDDRGELILSDGFYRLAAHERVGHKTIDVEVRRGNRHDAKIFAITANAYHGMKLTSHEKRRAVNTLFNDLVWRRRSDREIAAVCGCSPPTVAKIRKLHPLTENIGSDEVREVRNKHGARAPMKIDGLRRPPVDRQEGNRTGILPDTKRDIRAAKTAEDASVDVARRARRSREGTVDRVQTATAIVEALEAVRAQYGNAISIADAILASRDDALIRRFNEVSVTFRVASRKTRVKGKSNRDQEASNDR